MPQLDVSTYSSQIFWLVISFLLLFAVVRGLATPRLTQVTGARAAQSGGDLDAAEHARARAATHDADRGQRLAAAHDAARSAAAAAAERARDAGSTALAGLGARLGERTAEAEAALAHARAAAEAELDQAARDLAGELVERFTAARPSPERLAAAVAR